MWVSRKIRRRVKRAFEAYDKGIGIPGKQDNIPRVRVIFSNLAFYRCPPTGPFARGLFKSSAGAPLYTGQVLRVERKIRRNQPIRHFLFGPFQYIYSKHSEKWFDILQHYGLN